MSRFFSGKGVRSWDQIKAERAAEARREEEEEQHQQRCASARLAWENRPEAREAAWQREIDRARYEAELEANFYAHVRLGPG